jgi:two-component system NtrC family sensor kinase
MAVSQLETTAGQLSFLADVAVLLNGEEDLVRKATVVLERTVRAVGGSECSLWLSTPKGLACAARAGSRRSAPEELAPRLEAGDADHGTVSVRRLMAGSRTIGALVLRSEPGVSAEAATALTAVANMLAPVLSWAEQTRVLAAEVERRTRQLEEERRFIDRVVDSLPVSLYVIDRDYRVKAWNRGRESGSQGVQRERALGKTIFEILHRAPAEKLRREFDEVFRSGRIQQFNMESRATGESRTYRITKIPMQVVDGEPPSHVITIGEDVTDFTATQERFAQSEKLASIGQLAAGALHEVAGPLDTIASCAANLATHLDDLELDGVRLPPLSRETLNLVGGEVGRCKAIVGSLLDLTRPPTNQRTWTNANALLEQALGLLGHQPDFKRLSIQSFLEPDLPRIMATPDQLLQVFIAVLQNASDAMETGGTLTVRTRGGTSSHEAIVVEVIDEGRGISRSDLPHIFEPFFTTKGPGRGTGLGLAICYSIITDHGGRIEVDSAVGAGSTFRLLLPEGSTHE